MQIVLLDDFLLDDFWTVEPVIADIKQIYSFQFIY